jgi:hypothetical protein
MMVLHMLLISSLNLVKLYIVNFDKTYMPCFQEPGNIYAHSSCFGSMNLP